MSEIYTTNTASLKATIADIRKLNTKVIDVNKLNVNGQDIKELIEENKTVILDERGTLANDELDIWNSSIVTDEDGNVTIGAKVEPKKHTYNSLTSDQKYILQRASKVINNEVMDEDGNHMMFWQTDGFTETNYGNFDVNRPPLGMMTEFDSDLSSLTNGYEMFSHVYDLKSFKGDLNSLTNGKWMFYLCDRLETFAGDLSSLTNGEEMFYNCKKLGTFTGDLHSLTLESPKLRASIFRLSVVPLVKIISSSLFA